MGASVKLQDFEDGFDPFTAWAKIGGEDAIVDPYPELVRLRHLAPVHARDIREHFGLQPDLTMRDLKPYMVLGYENVTAAFGNPEVFSSKLFERNLGITFGSTITAMDAPEHTRYRKLFQSAFTPNRLLALSSIFQGVIDRLVANFIDRGKADLAQEFALHFPFQFITELMHLPVEDRPVFHKVAFAQTTIAFDTVHGQEASRRLGIYLDGLCAERRELHSDDDFVSAIANAEVEGERLPDHVLISFFRQLMNAGGDTSYHGFTCVLTALLTHPDQLEAVKRDRSLIPRAIDEALRWNCPILMITRTPKRDVNIGGVNIDAGACVSLVLGSANRDETHFENPDKFDIFRKPDRMLTFGYGPHICIGQHLARRELVMALNTLLDRLPNLRLNEDMPPPVVKGLQMRGAHSVHVKWG